MDKVVTPDLGGALHGTFDLFVGYGSDLFVFIGIAALVALFAFYFGRDRLVALIAGMYAAIPLYLNFPYMDILKGNAYLEIALFVGLAFVGLVAFASLASFLGIGTVGFFKVLALSAITAALVMAIAVNILPGKSIHAFSAPTLALFANPYLFFWWLAAPLAGVFLFGK